MTEAAGLESVIEVRDLVRKFRRKQALAGVDITVPRGVVYGLVGENGAGKTTLLKHILGSLRAQSGSVRVFGMDPVKEPVAVLSQLGYLSEDRDIPGWMRVGEAIGYTQAFYPGWDEAYAESLRERFELDERAKIKTLSRGEKAKCGLLLALAYRPPLLVLDEPSSGLDPSARHDILEAIVRTVADEGRTVLFSSHLLDEVERVADVVAMIHRGKVVFEESLDSIKARHGRLLVSREEEDGPAPELPGLLHASGGGREWTLVCEGELDALRTEATARGLLVLEADTPSLEDVFLARVAPGKRKGTAS
ncbi:MAG TPA: ABC transporter ATP-binding protein [Candidatus Hydrogenedentes bacterium]|nr:ABC transporter ATP-binding protein [Candidatus Hydrogenedentota bacterium]HQN01220.1 ABC transporter ATP-binding protein [Candidatus Hydrogenedentota bacterium]